MKKLVNKVAVITGGNSGLGLAAAKLFAENGAKVAITGRNKTTIDEAVKSIGNGAIGTVADVYDIRQIEAAYKKVFDSLGKIDIDTPIFGRGGGTKEEVDGTLAYFADYAPAKRVGKPEEIAAGFLFLASDDSKYMLGAELVIDGGVKAI